MKKTGHLLRQVRSVMPDFLKDVWLWTIEEAWRKKLWWYGWVFHSSLADSLDK